MKDQQTIKRRAVRTAPVALAGLAGLLAGVALGLQAGQPPAEKMPASQPAGPRHSMGSAGFSAMPPAPHVLQALRQQGKTFRDPFPDFANRGKKFNPQGELMRRRTRRSFGRRAG